MPVMVDQCGTSTDRRCIDPPRLVDAVCAHVFDGQATSLQHANWNLVGWPDCFGPH